MIRINGIWYFKHDGQLEGCYLTFSECLEACLRMKRRIATARLSVQTPRHWQTFMEVVNPHGYAQRRQRRAV